MKKPLYVILILILCNFFVATCHGEESKKMKIKSVESEYSIDILIKDIPKGEQSLYVPLKLDPTVVDLEKVALEELSHQNIIAVAATSKDKIGPGIGIVKLDEKEGLPASLTLKVFLKAVGKGNTSITVSMVANNPALPAKGTIIRDDIKASVINGENVEVTEKLQKEKKKLVLSENKLKLHVERNSQANETIFVPVIISSKVVDLDETFGHAVLGPGISAKSYSVSSLHEGGPGVEIVLSEIALKDFDVDVDLIPKGIGSATIEVAYPQEGRTALVTGPVVDIQPLSLSIGGKK